MVVIVQYPFVDLRPLIEWAPARPNQPAWSVNLENTAARNSFVRNFGEFGERYRGGVEGVVGENNKCDCNRAIRFHSHVKISELLEKRERTFHVTFRRMYFDGFASGRIEIGLADYPLWLKQAPPASRYQLAEIIDVLKTTGVTIHSDISSPDKARLFELSPKLAVALIQATTLHNDHKHIPDLLAIGALSFGLPLLYVRASQAEEILFPREHLLLSLGAGLSMLRYREREVRLVTWIQQYDYNSSPSEERHQRDLRVLLSRFNAEQYAMACFLDRVNKFKVAKTGRSARFLDEFVRRSVLNLEAAGRTSTRVAQEAERLRSKTALGHDTELLGELMKLAEARKEAKSEKGLLSYAKDFAVFVAKEATRVGIETVLKHATG
jgi:hypothetical protein